MVVGGFILRDDDVLKSHALAHGLRTLDFFYTSQMFGRISCEVFYGIFGRTLLKFFHCVFLVRDFALLIFFFLQKVKIFIHFTGFSIWVSVMDLGCRDFGI